ncbi:MAG TPA: CBS domain-containing protein [Gammaproteobacteria bacterium]|nr:CBS domain-containing protein [Gammaproteobacteria bacterium]
MNAETTHTVSDIMQREVHSVDDDWTLDELARFLTDHQISGAPVTSVDGRLVGVVSLTDIVRHDSNTEGEAEQADTHEYYLHGLEMQMNPEDAETFHLDPGLSTRVRDVMTPMVFEVDENTSVEDAADTMVKGHIHRLLVTRNGRIAGIVTALDMVRALRDRLGNDTRAAASWR